MDNGPGGASPKTGEWDRKREDQGSMSGWMERAIEEERPEMTSSWAGPSLERKRFGCWAELQVATGDKDRADTGDT